MRDLYLNTVSDNLAEVLNQLMRMEELKPFRLVGGTALSLQIGHRLSVDIDLFTDKLYGSVDFQFSDVDLDPICLKGKYWELIKGDFIEIIERIKK